MHLRTCLLADSKEIKVGIISNQFQLNAFFSVIVVDYFFLCIEGIYGRHLLR